MGLEFGLKEVIDILLVALIMYETYRLLKGTNTIYVFWGIISFIVCWFLVSHIFKMELLGAIMDKVMSVGAVALIVIFQNEIRRFFSMIGRRSNSRLLGWFNRGKADKNILSDTDVMQLVLACQNMARSKCGALIVVAGKANLLEYSALGEAIDAKINTRLIENIFFKNSPLHDGAMIIGNHKILSAGCILPLSQNPNMPKGMGLRHRAAMGISERTDTVVIVISEETGKISIVHHGKITTDVLPEQLERLLAKKQN